MRIKIFLALWQREDITRMCFEGIKRLQDSHHDVSAFAVLSEESMIDLCREYDISFVSAPNAPLGAKMNLGLQYVTQQMDFDYLLQINSDNLLANEIFDLYDPEFEKGTPYFGLRDIYFVDSDSLKSKYFSFDVGVIGAGKVFRKSFLEKVLPAMDWQLWAPKRNQGLDNDVYFRLSRLGYEPVVLYQNGPMAIDIKSKVNIWSFDDPQFDKGEFVDTSQVLERFPERELLLKYAL